MLPVPGRVPPREKAAIEVGPTDRVTSAPDFVEPVRLRPVTAEQELLVRCVRAAAAGQRIRTDESERIDWAVLCETAGRHESQQLLYGAVKGTPLETRIPEAPRTALRGAYYGTLIRNERLLSILKQVLQAAAVKGIRVMPLKGAVLAFRDYPTCALRPMADLDLLAREEDFSGLREVLDGLGYHCSLPVIRHQRLPLYSQCFRQIRFQSSSGPLLEVHFRLFNIGLPPRREDAWDDAEELSLDGTTVWVPSPDRCLLHLCLHAQQHAFNRLRFFVDIALGLQSRSVRPEQFVMLARQHRLATAAFYALTYTAHFVPLADCGHLRAPLTPPAWKRRLFERCWRDEDVRSLRVGCFHSEAELPRAFLLGEASLPAKMEFLWRVAFPPGAWLAGSDGRPKSRTYHVGRVLRQAVRGWSPPGPRPGQ